MRYDDASVDAFDDDMVVRSGYEHAIDLCAIEQHSDVAAFEFEKESSPAPSRRDRQNPPPGFERADHLDCMHRHRSNRFARIENEEVGGHVGNRTCETLTVNLNGDANAADPEIAKGVEEGTGPRQQHGGIGFGGLRFAGAFVPLDLPEPLNREVVGKIVPRSLHESLQSLGDAAPSAIPDHALRYRSEEYDC